MVDTVAALDLLAWAVVPYVVAAIFLVGLVWRYASDPYGWTSKSSELLERRMLAWGSQLFHWGFLLVFGGHVLGLLVPPSVDTMAGLPWPKYHLLSFFGGGVAGTLALVGLVILTVRRLSVPRVRASSSPTDFLTLAVLLVAIATGLFLSVGHSLVFGDYDYRDTVGVWIRSLFAFAPNVAIMSATPVDYRAHALLGLLFFAVVPFTRLVHIFSFPFQYLTRRYIVYRAIPAPRPIPGRSPPPLF